MSLHMSPRVLQLVRMHARGGIGIFIMVSAAMTALLAPTVAPHDPTKMSLPLRLKPPVWQTGGISGYMLGTDQLGRDLLSRIIFGTRISLTVASSTVLCSILIGVGLGLYAGYAVGRLPAAILWLVDVQMAFPWLVLALLVIAALGPSIRNMILVLTFVNWVVYCRLVRAQTLSLKEREFIMAAKAVGCGDWRIILTHILPNTIPSVSVMATYQMALMVVAEAAMSFLGLGVQPPTPSWGSIISDGRLYIEEGWWVSTFSGVVLVITTVGIGFFGDWLRQMLDPTLRV